MCVCVCSEFVVCVHTHQLTMIVLSNGLFFGIITQIHFCISSIEVIFAGLTHEAGILYLFSMIIAEKIHFGLGSSSLVIIRAMSQTSIIIAEKYTL